MPSRASPYYPTKELTYGQIYFFIKCKAFSINPFDQASIAEGKSIILREAKEASPNYAMFMKAAKLATGLSERTIKKFIYTKPKD